jgi:dipeptidyl-peptidase 4
MSSLTPDSLKFEDIARLPRPGTSAPSNLTFSPDNNILTYLHATGDDLQRQLYGLNLKTLETGVFVHAPGKDTEENLSLEEKLRRERQRLMAVGIQVYSWSRQGNYNSGGGRVLVPLQGNIYVQDLDGPGKGKLRQVFNKSSTGRSGGAIDAQLSPDGTMVGFVQEAEIYVAKICEPNATEMCPAVQITQGARGNGKMNGLADFIAQEEMDRYRGFWWAPNSKKIAYEQVDESHIPIYRILHQGKDIVGDNAQEDHHYPFAGAANPKVKLGVVDVPEILPSNSNEISDDGKSLSSTKPRSLWMDLGKDEDIYLARVNWMCDGRLCAQIENRLQTELNLQVFDLTNGESSLLLQETNATWINLHNLFTSFYCKSEGDELECVHFLWGAERTGFMKLYLYKIDASGNNIKCINDNITNANGVVEGIIGLSPRKNVIYFKGTDEHLNGPPQGNLYAAPLFKTTNFEKPLRITTGGGEHSIIMDGKMTRVVDISTNINTPPTCILYALHESLTDGASIVQISNDADNKIELLKKVHVISKATVSSEMKNMLKIPELKICKSPKGHDLHAAVFKPDVSKWGEGPYPLIVEVYGGPHVQRVRNHWATTVNMRVQSFCNRGYLVLMLDNRGSFRRGLKFEGELRHRMGTVEVEDQVCGVKWLVKEGLADANRVGVYGWSYGGYMSLMCLMQAPNVFHAAVSGAPVTHWDGYDTHYTERYMGLPQDNKEGYAGGSVMKFVPKMEGKLMLIHGLIDENVHARHTFRLINSLIAARKQYSLFIFPNERHSPRNYGDRVYMEEQIFNFLNDALLSRDNKL